MSAAQEVVVIYWEWTETTPHCGARFWGCHARESDGRIRDWPKLGLRPLAAATVTISEGDGLELVAEMQS